MQHGCFFAPETGFSGPSLRGAAFGVARERRRGTRAPGCGGEGALRPGRALCSRAGPVHLPAALPPARKFSQVRRSGLGSASTGARSARLSETRSLVGRVSGPWRRGAGLAPCEREGSGLQADAAVAIATRGQTGRRASSCGVRWRPQPQKEAT